MCGFVGRIIADPDRTRVPLAAALTFLRRRGPDSWAHWQDASGRVELLHARLAIVDQDDRARQPFSDPQTGLTVVFNGEVYNHLELRRQLAGFPFRTDSDTEVLLAAVAEWGLDGLKGIRGMFACCIVDSRSGRIWLARDPIGKKPLFYARWQDGVYFGSSVLAMAVVTRAAVTVRDELRQDYWNFDYIPPDQSLIAGCRPVEPGEVVELDGQGREIRRVGCRVGYESAPVHSVEEAHERVETLLDQSMARRMHNNPAPVSLLSGGIDSTVVTQWMHRQAGGAAITLRSLIPWGCDEKYARYAARRIGIRLELVDVKARRMADEVRWALDLQDEPLAVMSFLPLALLIRQARQHGKILLTGDGADELFLGYGRPQDWSDPEHGAGRYDPRALAIEVGTAAPPWMSPWGRWASGHSLLGHMFPKLDRAASEQGVEARCPLIDLDLVGFVKSLPPEQLFADGRSKGLLKRQLSGWPRWFVERRKMGFRYHLRWAWALRGFAGLREMVRPEAVEAFEPWLPPPLRRRPQLWPGRAIFRDFPAVWKVLAWSRFLARLEMAANVREQAADTRVHADLEVK